MFKANYIYKYWLLLLVLCIFSHHSYATSARDIRDAKRIEDVYRYLKSKSYRKALPFVNALKRSKSLPAKKLKNIIYLGAKLTPRLARDKECPHFSANENYNYVELRFYKLYKKACSTKVITNMGKRQRAQFTKNEKRLLNEDIDFFVKYVKERDLKKRQIYLDEDQKEFLSDSLKKYIRQEKMLPPQHLLTYLIPDYEITKFIQDNKLFDKENNKYYTRVLSKMVKTFESKFIDSDDLDAEAHLKGMKSFYESNKSYINDEKLWKSFIRNGKKLLKSQDYSYALDFFQASKKYASEENLDESIFQIIFTKYLKNDMYEARNIIKKSKLIENRKNYDSRLMYWIAYIVDINKELKLAKELYNDVITTHPLSFYAILSLNRLHKLSPDTTSDLIVQDNNYNLSKMSLRRKALADIKLLKVFKDAKTYILLNLQASLLRKMPAQKFYQQSNKDNAAYEKYKAHHLIKLFSKHALHLQSFKEAYSNLNNKTIALNKSVIDGLFPKSFSKHVKKANQKIDYRIVLSLIRQESGFNQLARSPAGARGLMQIMPTTGKYLKKSLKTRQLYNPKTNIALGSKYLKYLIKKFKGNLMFALAAYNAGEGNVRKWQRTIPFTNDIISDIELIPFKETRKYVKLIYRNLFFYRFKDGDRDILKETPHKTFNILTSEFKH